MAIASIAKEKGIMSKRQIKTYLVCACWSAPKENLCARYLSRNPKDYEPYLGKSLPKSWSPKNPLKNPSLALRNLYPVKNPHLAFPTQNALPDLQFTGLKRHLKKVFVNRIKEKSESDPHQPLDYAYKN